MPTLNDDLWQTLDDDGNGHWAEMAAGSFQYIWVSFVPVLTAEAWWKSLMPA